MSIRVRALRSWGGRGEKRRKPKETTMQARMKNPVLITPGVLPAALAISEALKKGKVPESTLTFVQLRVSQINGCSFCVDMHARELKSAGESDERIFGVAAFRDMPCFSDAERAALALAEAATRLDDRSDPVPDAIWNEAARHYDEASLGVLLVNIAMINFWNRVNVPTKQIAGVRHG
jgi:AhpD family alkylhydroperoxidase